MVAPVGSSSREQLGGKPVPHRDRLQRAPQIPVVGHVVLAVVDRPTRRVQVVSNAITRRQEGDLAGQELQLLSTTRRASRTEPTRLSSAPSSRARAG